MLRKNLFITAMVATLLSVTFVVAQEEEAQAAESAEAVEAQPETTEAAEAETQPAEAQPETAEAVEEAQPVEAQVEAAQPAQPEAPAVSTPTPTPVPRPATGGAPISGNVRTARTSGSRFIEFVVTPNPINRLDGEPVIFSIDGEEVTNWSLDILDSRSQRVFRINSATPTARWDLINTRGITVNAGQYEVRGRATLSNGRRESVNALFSVR